MNVDAKLKIVLQVSNSTQTLTFVTASAQLKNARKANTLTTPPADVSVNHTIAHHRIISTPKFASVFVKNQLLQMKNVDLTSTGVQLFVHVNVTQIQLQQI